MFFDLPAAPPQLPANSPSPERHSKGADGPATTTPGKLHAAGRKMLCHDGRGGAVLRDWAAAPPDPAQQAAGAALRTAPDAELRSLVYPTSGRQPRQPPAQRAAAAPPPRPPAPARRTRACARPSTRQSGGGRDREGKWCGCG